MIRLTVEDSKSSAFECLVQSLRLRHWPAPTGAPRLLTTQVYVDGLFHRISCFARTGRGLKLEWELA